jgi:hypothetical protein
MLLGGSGDWVVAIVIESHPAADIFPMLSESDLSILADDIRAHGLHEPIALLGGKILDGRNRYQACLRVGVDPRTVSISTDEPVAYVMSHNLHRRHLTTSQRGAIAAEALPLIKEEARLRQEASRAVHGQKIGSKVVQNPAPPSEVRDPKFANVGRSREIAAKLLNVSHDTVDCAIAIKKADPVLFEQAKRGEITIHAAYEKIASTKQPSTNGDRRSRHSLPLVGTEKRENMEGVAKRRMITALSAIEEGCVGLLSIDAELLRSGFSGEECASWVKSARSSAAKLKQFAQSIQARKDNNGNSQAENTHEAASRF